ncbi:MAG TPA: hypothetical protein VGL58_16420 [Caulobacteraceae bacterium]|jgi:hypothetical protein
MSFAVVARFAKLIALIGFMLPWVLVSCGHQPAAHLSGIDLATGTAITGDVPTAGQASQGHPDLWIAASLLLVIVGLAAGLLLRGSRAAAAMAATSAAALALASIGVWRIASAYPAQGSDASAVVQAQAEYGFLLTCAGLIVCFGASVAWLSGAPDRSLSATGPTAG